MFIRVLASTLVGGIWHEPGVGSYEPGLGQHLIDIGSAELYEAKIINNIEVKPVKKPISGVVSQPAPVSRKKIARKSKKAE